MKKITLIYLSILCLISLSCSAQESTNTIDELNAKIEKLFSKSELPGLSLVVVNDKSILYQKSIGYADIENKKSFTNKSIQNIGSISKTFIAFAIMKAVDQGKVNLDDDINNYLPFIVEHPLYPKIPITIRQLAYHTSGISDESAYDKSYVLKNPNNSDYSKLPKKIKKYLGSVQGNKLIDDSEFLENVLSKNGKWYSKNSFTKIAPGEEFEYSNIASALAAYVVEKAVGKSYEDYTREHIFKPLNMLESGWEEADVDITEYVTRYFPDNYLVPNYHLITRADGGFVTNSTDFSKYLIEMMNGYNGKGTLLTKESYKEMFTRRKFGKEYGGVFWSINENGSPSHNGADPGILANTSFNPKKNMGIFIMTNVSADMDNKLMKPLVKTWRAIKNHNWK